MQNVVRLADDRVPGSRYEYQTLGERVNRVQAWILRDVGCYGSLDFPVKQTGCPLMRNVLADMVALETEAATALSMRLARAFDAQEDEAESLLRRILTPVAKFWICKRCPTLVAEAMEVHGGNGYVEEGPMPRLFLLGALHWTAQWYRPDGSLTIARIAQRLADFVIGKPRQATPAGARRR